MLVCASLHHLARETAGAARTRSSLRPLYYEGGPNRPSLARNRRRECEGVPCRHCEERSDEAIHSFLSSLDGLLRYARNDGYLAAKIRFARSAPAPRRTDPVLQRHPDAARQAEAVDRGGGAQRLEAVQFDAAPLEAAFLQ